HTDEDDDKAFGFTIPQDNAWERKKLLLYHVVADYEAEEDDKFLDSDTTGQMPSRLQQRDHNIVNKLAEFATMFEKQVNTFNNLTHKQATGELRAEEQLMG
ncbi:hypothetical protein IFM89_002685, partial [Coptis chinensis]